MMRYWVWRGALLWAAVCASAVGIALWAGAGLRADILAFERLGSNNFDIMVWDVERGILHNLTRHPANDHTPYWSPDGETLYFISNRDERYSHYRVRADGRSPEPARELPEIGSQYRLSPDGRFMAYLAAATYNSDIIVMERASGMTRNLTNTPEDERYPSWSPDGRYIAFLSSRRGTSGLFIMESDGSGLRNLATSLVAYTSPPSWSPDGAFIAFTTVTDSIFVVDVATAQVGRLGGRRIQGIYPAWSPNGRRVAYARVFNYNYDAEVEVLDLHSDRILRPTRGRYTNVPVWRP